MRNNNHHTEESNNNLENLQKEFMNNMKALFGTRKASSISKLSGVSVSTITRIRNGENKRGISEETLQKLFNAREKNCDINYHELSVLNTELGNAYMNKDVEKWKQDDKEIEFLLSKIKDNMFNSEVMCRMIKKQFIIIHDIELYPEMAFEVGLNSGERKTILFETKFHSKRRMEQMDARKQEDPSNSGIYCGSLFRKILEFKEMQALHKEYENCELIIVFNYEDEFNESYNVLKKLSNVKNISFALINHSSGKYIEEKCLDGRKKGILTELGLIKSK